MSHRSALQGMDPEEAFRRLGSIVETYLDLRFEAVAAGIVEPLEDLPALCKVKNERLSTFAKALTEQLSWLRQWFPKCSPTELVHMADLVSRAMNRHVNRDTEKQFLRLVTIELGTDRARELLNQVETGRRAAPKRTSPSRQQTQAQTRQFLRRVSGK